MNDSGGPHPEQQREAQTTNCEEIDHQVDPEWAFEAHLREHPERRNKQGDDDTKDIAAGHRKHRRVLLS